MSRLGGPFPPKGRGPLHIFGDTVSLGTAVFLLLALGLALSFEFVNGFHDTANAVATVIYTHTLKPTVAVIWSGCWNLLGVLASSGAVAFAVLALLPVELVMNVGSGAGFAMVFALLISAIIWNLGTWYLGLPASSSHTLIGSIMGVGLANSWINGGHEFGEGVNWAKAEEVGLSLLVLTCTGVSFFHGSNDGQKGMGLIMLILVGILPASYALNSGTDVAETAALLRQSEANTVVLDRFVNPHAAPVLHDYATQDLSAYLKTSGKVTEDTYSALANKNREITETLAGHAKIADLEPFARTALRTQIYLVSETIGKLAKQGLLKDPEQKTQLLSYKRSLEVTTKFIPSWVKVMVAFTLGLGTMIGWKRIVVTVGEKIGKEHLTYAQGASAEIVAMGTIGLADYFGLPVSTTHVLSSGVAGTMAANRSGLQMGTLRNLLLAWVLTLPVCVLLGAATFAAGLFVVLNVFGVH